MEFAMWLGLVLLVPMTTVVSAVWAVRTSRLHGKDAARATWVVCVACGLSMAVGFVATAADPTWVDDGVLERLDAPDQVLWGLATAGLAFLPVWLAVYLLDRGRSLLRKVCV